MSLEGCQSWERVRRRDYVPGSSPDKLKTFGDSQYVLNAQNTYFQHYTRANENRKSKCFYEHNDNNVEYLEDLEDPQFFNLPPDSSFDEVRCIMATPLRTAPPAAFVEPANLDELEPEIAEAVQPDNLRKRNVKCIDWQYSPGQNDVRKGITAVISENVAEPSFCLYKNAPRPKDPLKIPPTPKHSKDVVAVIRRAKTLARLKELQKKKAPLEQSKNTGRKAAINLKAQRKFTRNVPYSPKFKAVATKISNAKFISKPKIDPDPSATKSKSPLQPATPPPSIPTFESILERISIIRSRTDVAKPVLGRKKRDILKPRPQEESEALDEFEVLEELYGAVKPAQCPPKRQSFSDLRKRINILEQQLLPSPMLMEPQAEEELDEFVALEQQHASTAYFGQSVPVHYTTDLRDRINTLKEKLFQSPIRDQSSVYPQLPSIHRYEDLQQSKDVKEATATNMDSMHVCPSSQNVLQTRSVMPSSAVFSQYSSSPTDDWHTRLQKFDDAVTQNEIHKYVFSAEPLADAGDNVSLDEITMPDFDEDISFDNVGVADITTPELWDLSISGYDSEFFAEISPKQTKDDHITKKDVSEKVSEQPGVLTSFVNALVERFKNIFSTPKATDAQNAMEAEVELDTSLPTIFEITPSTDTNMSKSAQTATENTDVQKPVIPRRSTVIPPHPKDPKDYKAMVKRAQAIQKEKIVESATAKDSAFFLPKAAPLAKEKLPMQNKKTDEKLRSVYHLGEYSPSYIKAVARARSIAGLKNLSAVFNPERAAKIAKEKAAEEEKLAVIESLPPVERLKEKMKSMRREVGMLPSLSMEVMVTLEDIRANFPKSEIKSRRSKWRPADRLRVDRRLKPSESIFSHDFGRILFPTGKTQIKKNWQKLSNMSPILEEPELNYDLIKFSPLKPDEARMRLHYLKDQAAKKTVKSLRSEEEKQVEIDTAPTPVSPMHLSPIRLHSPSGPRTEEIRREKIITKFGPLERPGITTEETEISIMNSDKTHTSTRQVARKTDEYGNITYDMQEGSFVSGEAGAFPDDLADTEPPDFLDTSDMTPPRDLSIPTTNEIINRIRSKIKQNFNYACPDVHNSLFFASPQSLGFPQDLPDENLIDIKIPEFQKTPRMISPRLKKSSSPCEKDIRMYAWGEHPPASPPTRTATSIVSPAPPAQTKDITPLRKIKPVEETIFIPPHPKDPKDYKAIINRARAIHLKKQQEICIVPSKGSKRPQKGSLTLKKGVPKLSPKNAEQRKCYDKDYLTELPPLSKKYKEPITRARLLFGLKNKTAALNLAVAEKKAKKKNSKIAYDALPEVEKIKIRLEKLRKHPLKRRNIEQSAHEEFEALEAESKKLHNFVTPKRSKRHGQRRLIHELSSSEKLIEAEPPRNIQERFQRLKDAQEKQYLPSEYAVKDLVYPAVPVYSPIKLISPIGIVYRAPEQLSSPYFLKENECMFNIEETPKRVINPVKQFKDLEDIPFDELEYENEPTLADISFDKPLSPPPRPSDIISKIKSKVKEITQRSAPPPLPTLKFPKDLPAEDLLELSAPSFLLTPRTSPLKQYKSPRISHPVAWREMRSATPITAKNVVAGIPPIKNPKSLPSQEAFEEGLPHNNLILVPPQPRGSKDYDTIVSYPRAIYKINKQKKTDEAATSTQPPNTRRNDRLPISKWRIPPPKNISTNRRRKLVLRERAKESDKIESRKNYPLPEKEKKYPTEPLALPQDYRNTVAKTRLLHGLKNRTAAVNSKIEARKAAELPEMEKIRVRMERLRKTPQRKFGNKPTMEQIACLEAVKEINQLHTLSSALFTKRKKLLDAEDVSQFEDMSLAEFEALEALEGPHVQQAEQPFTPLNINRLISNLRQQQLATPPHLSPPERLRQLMATRKDPCTPITSPTEAPEIHYTPIILSSSPEKEEQNKRVQQTNGQIARTAGLIGFDHVEDLENIQEPSYLETTPSTPMERPIPRDIIERVRAQVKRSCKPEVPTGQLLELRPPPRMLALPTELPAEELLNVSCPSSVIIPPTPEYSPTRSPDISIPQLFQLTPSPHPPLSPLRYQTLSSKGPLVIPTQLKDPEDYKAMIRRVLSRIKEFKEKDVLSHCNPALHAAYYNTLKNEMQTAAQTCTSRNERNQFEKANIPSSFEDIPVTIPIRFISANSDEAYIDSAESLTQHKLNLAAFEDLDELEELSEIEQPSYVDISKHHTTDSQYLPLISPQTPPPAPADIINRIRQQYYQKNTVTPHAMPMSTPVSLKFPEILPDEQISELNTPSLAKTPVDLQTPVTTPNVSLPQYFEEFANPIKSSSPTAGVIEENVNSESRSVRRSQVIRKLLAKEAADKAAISKHAAALQTSAAAMGTPHRYSYATVKENLAALRTSHKKRQSPYAREITHEQHLINRKQRQPCKRILNELEQLEQQQSSKFQLLNKSNPPEKRLKALKSRIAAENSSSAYPYSPIKTPKVIDIQQFQPLALRQTPLYPFLENVSITDIADMSVQFDGLDNYTLESETEDEEDLEFQLAEIANEAYEFDENIDVSESNKAKNHFNITERIQKLRQQLLKSSDESDANTLEEQNINQK